MTEAVIVATSRSPIGRAVKGSLVDLRPDDMAAQIVRALMAKVPQVSASDVEDLIRIGAYNKGTNPETDRAVELIGPIRTFLRQEVGQRVELAETVNAMQRLAGMWPY